MEFSTLIGRAVAVRQKYCELEQARYGRSWTKEEITLGFVGDVGDLAKLVMAQEGIRNIPDREAKLAHELADCLWSVMILAHLYDIELEQTFIETMDELDQHIESQLSS